MEIRRNTQAKTPSKNTSPASWGSKLLRRKLRKPYFLYLLRLTTDNYSSDYGLLLEVIHFPLDFKV